MFDLRPLLRRWIAWLDLREEKRRIAALPVCQRCNRHVPSPCHNAEGFHMEGPWDSWCRDFF